jgi:tetratricopeptide (TPR) repeat protein
MARLRLAPLALALALGAGVPAVSLPLLAAPSQGKSGLPRLATTVLPAPEPSTVTELDQALAQILSGKPDDAKAGQARLKEAGGALLPAMSRRLAELRKSANREQIGTYITEARKGRRKGDSDEDKEPKKKKKGDKKPEAPPGEDAGWLPLVLAKSHGDQAQRDLVTVLVIERALVDLGTTAAVRELVNVYIYFGDLFRIDVQHMLSRLGDRAVPALIEARKHDAEKVRRWAARQLDAIGKAVPGETVQILDQEVLADVLRAYGRTRDIDALRVVVSFTSSDRLLIREAAREALVNYGDAALWQLREAFENLTGKRPPAGTPWDKLALELFETHDRGRLEEIFGTFEEGLARFKEGKLDEMATHFDAVLARAPTFERKGEMVEGYLALARKNEDSDLSRALLCARKALRLDPANPQAKGIESYILTLESEQLAQSGLTDTAPLRRALELDPNNARARTTLARLESNPAARAHGGYRYLAAGVIGLVGILAALLVGFRRHDPPPRPPAPPSPPGPPGPDPATPPPPSSDGGAGLLAG